MTTAEQETGSRGTTRLGPYRLVTELGRGGMGVVHMGLDPRGRAVAVKVLHDHVSGEPSARARLSREVGHLSRVRHPGVASILDADVTGARPYVVTRYVPGPSLERHVATSGPLHGEALAVLAHDLSEALVAIHEAGVVHRDLKPANVLIAQGRPVLIDFGIAQGSGDARLTLTGLVMGTPGFLAPEVLDGAPVTPATDWWAWAATLAYAASGRVPFGDHPVEAVLARIRLGEPDLRGVDVRLAPLLSAALAPDPARRPDRHVIIEAMQEYAAGGVATAALPSVPPTRVFPAPPVSRPVEPSPIPQPWVQPPGTAMARPVAPAGVVAPRTVAPYAGPSYGAAPPLAGPPAAQHPLPGEAVAPGVAPAVSRRSGTLIALGALLAAGCAVAPTVALLAALAWAWAARTVDRSMLGLMLRRSERGRRRGDVAGAWVRSPAHALVAVVATLLAGVLPVFVGSSVAVGVAGLLSTSSGRAIGVGTPGPLVAGAALGLVTAWWGPGGAPVRRGSRVMARTLAPGRVGAVVAVAVFLVAAAGLGLVSQSSGFHVTWAPLGGDPFAWLTGR